MDVEIRIRPYRRKCNKIRQKVYLEVKDTPPGQPVRIKPMATCDHSHMCGDNWRDCKVKGIAISHLHPPEPA